MLKLVPLLVAAGMIWSNTSSSMKPVLLFLLGVSSESESDSSESDGSEEEDWERSIDLVGGSSTDSRLSLVLAVNPVGAVLMMDAVVLDLLFEFC